MAAARAVRDRGRGARDFLRTRADLVTRVPCDGAGSLADLDTPADLAAHRALRRARASHQE